MAAPSADDFYLRVTAGTSYDRATHVDVPVNGPSAVRLQGAAAQVALRVRIDGFVDGGGHDDDDDDGNDDGGTRSTTPRTSPYFAVPPHPANGDTYSIALWFTPTADIAAADLQWGNDLDRPIRDHLPPGVQTAVRILRWWVDPGLDGDVYADRPHLYGPALSSFNRVWVGGEDSDPEKGDSDLLEHIPEGGDPAFRAAAGCPPVDGEAVAVVAAAAKARQRWALTEAAQARWVWARGRSYGLDFFNGYIDFGALAVRLPGFRVSVMPYWDGQSLRYVLRNRTTEEVYLVVEMTPVRRGGGGGDVVDGKPETWTAEKAGETTDETTNETAGTTDRTDRTDTIDTTDTTATFNADTPA